MKIRAILAAASTAEIAKAIDESFKEIAKHYVTRNWKTSGLDAGHFVEAVRRFLEFKLLGAATPIGKNLPKFNEAALKAYENGAGDEAYRIIIPRLLWSLYALRNKRSIGHLGAVPANEIDATLLLYGAKWTLAELIRLNGGASIDETKRLVRHVIERQVEVIWREGDIIRVLDPKIPVRDQIILLLMLAGDQSEGNLKARTGYVNGSNFRKILKRLHAARLIEYTPEQCTISPAGRQEAERMLEARGII